VVYTSNDIRFTTKGNTIYAIALDWPGEEITVESFKVLEPKKIKSILMLGVKGELKWEQTENWLKIRTPKKKPCEHAYSFKIVYSERLPQPESE